MTVLFTTFISIISIAAWVSIFAVIPSCTRSFFRYRLWHLRDDIASGLRHERYEDGKQATILLRDVEMTIANAKEVSLFRVALILAVGPREGFDDVEAFSLQRAHPKDRPLLAKQEQEYQLAFAKHVLVGSPSGWLALALFFPPALIAAGVGSLRKPVRVTWGRAKKMLQDRVPPAEPTMRRVRYELRQEDLWRHAT